MAFLGHSELHSTIREFDLIKGPFPKSFSQVEFENDFIKGIIAPIKLVFRWDSRAIIIHQVDTDLGLKVFEEADFDPNPRTTEFIKAIFETIPANVFSFDSSELIMKFAGDFDLLDPGVVFVLIEFERIVRPPSAEVTERTTGLVFEGVCLIFENLFAVRKLC